VLRHRSLFYSESKNEVASALILCLGVVSTNETLDKTSFRGVILVLAKSETEETLRGEGVTLKTLGTGVGRKSPALAFA
jgi:hypothetical protein